MKTRTFVTDYNTENGILMVAGDTYFILVRVRDGLCKRFSWRWFDGLLSDEVDAPQEVKVL